MPECITWPAGTRKMIMIHDMTLNNMHKTLSMFLRFMGFAILIIGIIGAFYGPYEFYIFYLFSEGGPFYYHGFGFGSLWFAASVIQVAGYYLVAMLCIPVGIGHIRLRRWALTLTRLYTWFWSGAGILLFVHFLFLLPRLSTLNRNGTGLQLVPIIVFLLIFLIILPLFALWFYRRSAVQIIFEKHDPAIYWTEQYPFPLLALLFLMAGMIIVLHIAILFQCLFPLFGQISLGGQSIYYIAAFILILCILMYGIVRMEIWAWWGSMIVISVMAISAAMSFARNSFYDIVQMMDLPSTEMGFIEKSAMIYDVNIVALVVLPMIAALGLTAYSKRYFE